MTSPDWRQLFWTANETDSDHAERVAAAEKTARWYFDRATRPQLATYLQTLRDQAPYYRSPKAERARADALRLFRTETEEASKLFELTAAEHMETGEVSESTSFKWDAIGVPVAEAAAREREDA